jgi:hypothetical protein
MTADPAGKDDLCKYKYLTDCMDFTHRDGKVGGVRGFSEFKLADYPFRGSITYDEGIPEQDGDKVCLFTPECGVGKNMGCLETFAGPVLEWNSPSDRWHNLEPGFYTVCR